MNFCPNCGAKLAHPGEDKFCMNCGAKIPVIPPESAASTAPQAAPTAAEGPAFSGVPVPPQAPQKGPVPAQPQQPRGEDLLNMIEEAQNQTAAASPSLFAEAQTLPDDASTPAGAPADLFAQNASAQGQQNMFNTTVMQSVKPPPSGQPTHPGAPARGAVQARPASAPSSKPAAHAQQSADLFASAAPSQAQPKAELFEGALQDPVQASTMNAAQQQADPGQPNLFDTAAMLAEDGETPMPPRRQPAPRRAAAPSHPTGYGDTHGQTAQRPRVSQRTAPRPLREEAFDDSRIDPAKPHRAVPPPVTLPEPEVEIKKPSVIGRILTAFAILIIFLVVCACTILVMLYFRNRPHQTIDAFAEAVAAGDTAQLSKLATVDGLTPSDADWQAFCAAFSTQAELDELKSQLRVMAEEEPTAEQAASFLYPAVTIEGKPFILFIDRYHINVQAVSLVAPGATDGTTVLLNEASHTGTLQADGVLYTGLMPGRYQCRVVAPGVLPENVPPEDVEIFGVDGPNYLEGEAPKVEVTISNCASDDAVLYVNDQPVAERPSGGVVTIPNVQLGSTIRISAIKDGVEMEASVTFNDLNTTQLAFADYTTQGQPASSSDSTSASTSGGEVSITADEINSILGTFYQSYLECINQQKMDGIQNTTSTANTALEARIKSDSNASNLFQYTGAAVDADSIKTTTSGELQAVQFNATFQFGYKGRDAEGGYTASSNHQSVEMVHQDGKWLINRMAFVSDGDFNNHTIASFE